MQEVETYSKISEDLSVLGLDFRGLIVAKLLVLEITNTNYFETTNELSDGYSYRLFRL